MTFKRDGFSKNDVFTCLPPGAVHASEAEKRQLAFQRTAVENMTPALKPEKNKTVTIGPFTLRVG